MKGIIGHEGFSLTPFEEILVGNRLISTANNVIARIEYEIGRPLIGSHYTKSMSEGVTHVGYWKFKHPIWRNRVVLDVMGVSIAEDIMSLIDQLNEDPLNEVWLSAMKLKLDPPEYINVMETWGEVPYITAEAMEAMSVEDALSINKGIRDKAEQLGLDQNYLNLQGISRGYHDRIKFFISIPTKQLNARNSQLQLDTIGIEFYHFSLGQKTYDPRSTENAYLSLATSDTRNKVTLATWILQGLVHAERIEIIEHWP